MPGCAVGPGEQAVEARVGGEIGERVLEPRLGDGEGLAGGARVVLHEEVEPRLHDREGAERQQSRRWRSAW